MRILFYLFLISTVIAVINIYLYGKKGRKVSIDIFTSNDEIKINNYKTKTFNLKEIKKIIGKANRIEVVESENIISEIRPDGDIKGNYSRKIKVKNYYYIYDDLGIIFKTDNKTEVENKEPNMLIFFFPSKREFSHTKKEPFMTKHKFKGLMRINNIIVNPEKSLLPKDINYETKEFNLYNTTFSPTSFTTIIDRVYSFSEKLVIDIFLNNKKEQMISKIIVRSSL